LPRDVFYRTDPSHVLGWISLPQNCCAPAILASKLWAWLIKAKSIVAGSWITKELDMGHPNNVSRAVNVFRTANHQKIKDLKRQLHVCKD
jgi:hypothetical protein